MNADGSGKRRLTRNAFAEASPTWSPDGTRVAVARHRDWGTEQARGWIVAVDVATGDEEELLPPGDELALIGDVAWSPARDVLAFSRATLEGERLESRLHLLDLESGDETLLFDATYTASWSPDGERLAVTTTRDGFGETCFHDCAPSAEIYVIDADGDVIRRLTRSEASDGEPTWAPDGERLAFVSDRSNRDEHEYEIWTIGAEGGAPTRVTRNDVWDVDPDWR